MSLGLQDTAGTRQGKRSMVQAAIYCDKALRSLRVAFQEEVTQVSSIP